MGKTVSQSRVSGGDTLTYSIGITVAGNSLTSPVVTDTLPAYMRFVSFGASPAGTSASFNASNDQLSWTLPSPLAPGVYQLNYEAQVSTSAPANSTLTNFAQMSYSGAISALTASVPVTVTGQFTIKVNVYNSAGEIVKTIVIQQFSHPVDNITLSTTNRITTLHGSGSIISIVYNGYVIGIWDGSNNSGQPVSNGTYAIQVDSISPAGTVTSVSQDAIVNRNLANLSADIFNSAGELIRSLYKMVDDASAVGPNMNEVILGSNMIRLGASSSVSQGPGPAIHILITDGGTPVTLTWDGTNNNDNYVSPGGYTVQVHWYAGSQQDQVIVREVVVLPSMVPANAVVVRPNVLSARNGTTATFDASSIAEASSIRVQIYTLAGEKIGTWDSSSGSPQLPWNTMGMASGVYVAVVTVQNANGGTLRTERHKVMVLR